MSWKPAIWPCCLWLFPEEKCVRHKDVRKRGFGWALSVGTPVCIPFPHLLSRGSNLKCRGSASKQVKQLGNWGALPGPWPSVPLGNVKSVLPDLVIFKRDWKSVFFKWTELPTHCYVLQTLCLVNILEASLNTLVTCHVGPFASDHQFQIVFAFCRANEYSK